MKPKPPAAARARELHARGLSAGPIVGQLRAEGYAARRSWVERWIQPAGKRGRPRKGVRHVVYLDDEIDALVRAEAERDGIAIEHVLRSAIASGVLPEGGWLAHQRRHYCEQKP